MWFAYVLIWIEILEMKKMGFEERYLMKFLKIGGFQGTRETLTVETLYLLLISKEHNICKYAIAKRDSNVS